MMEMETIASPKALNRLRSYASANFIRSHSMSPNNPAHPPHVESAKSEEWASLDLGRANQTLPKRPPTRSTVRQCHRIHRWAQVAGGPRIESWPRGGHLKARQSEKNSRPLQKNRR